MNIKKQMELARRGHILIYFSTHTINCGFTKANKLLYYLDCYHLLKYGRKVTHDVYCPLPEGPVPSDTYRRLNAIKEMISPDEGLSTDTTKNFKEYLSNFVGIKVKQISDNCSLQKIIPKIEFDPKWFSKSELDILSEVASEFKYATATQLSEKTHRELPYIVAKDEDSEEINLTLFLKYKELPEERIKEVVEIENEIKSMELNYNCPVHGIL